MKTSRAILCLALGQTILWAGMFYIFPALLLRWEAAEGWSKTTLTAALSGAIVVSAICAPFVGRLIDRGHGPGLMTGAAIFGSGLIALLPFAETIWAFVGIWLFIGAATSACLYEPCFALITRTRGHEARRAITFVSLVAGFAGTLSFPLNHVIAEAYGWQAATTTFAILMVTCGAPLIWLGANALESGFKASARTAPETNTIGGSATALAATDIIRRPAFWFLALGFSLLALNHGVVLNHLLPIFKDRGVSSDMAVFAASMIGPMQVAGRLAMMAAERRVSSHAITTACFVAVTLATASLYVSAFNSSFIAAFVLLQGSGFGVISIMKPVIIRELLGEKNFGAINGAMASPYLIAVAVSPFLGSLLWEIGGYNLALIVVGFGGLIGLICYRIAVILSIDRPTTRNHDA